MFGTFRRHQQWIWILGVVVIIPSFVIYFSPGSGRGGGRGGKMPGVDLGAFNGRPIERDDYLPALRETKLNYFMRSGGREWPANDENSNRNMQRDAIFRLFLLDKIKDLDIHVSEQAVARTARDRLGDFPPDKFERDVLSQQGLTLEDFERYMHHEVAIQQLMSVAAATARMLTPREAESLFRKENEQVATEVAGFWATNYLSKVQVSPDAISKYYSNHLSSYRIPERIQVSYIEFGPSNFLAEAEKEINQKTNLNTFAEGEYLRRGGTNTFKDTNGVPLSEKVAREQIKQETLTHFALMSARRKAAEFGNKLLDQKQQTLQTFEKLAAAEGYPVKISPPFSAMQGLDDTNFPPAFTEKALTLKKENPIFYAPIPGEHAIYLLALKTNLASELPSLEKIRDKVTADYKRSEALTLARNEGRSFHGIVTNGLAQKKTFDQLCAQANLKPIVVPPFAASTNAIAGLDERITFRTLVSDAFELKPGQAGEFKPAQEGGFIVYVKERIPVSDAQVKAELPEFFGKLRIYRQNEAFNDWFRREAEQARLTLPKSQTEVSAGGR